jgi:hypothetical protein
MSEWGSGGGGEPVTEPPHAPPPHAALPAAVPPAAGAGRRLSGRETAFWYGLAGLTYVGVGIFHKFLLNWFVGPLWLVAVVWLGPELVDLVRARSSRRGRGRGRVRQ